MDCVLDTGKNAFHGLRDDTRLPVVSYFERGKGQHPYIPQWEECEDVLTGVEVFPEAVHPQVNTTELHLCYVVPGDLVVNRFVFGSGDEFVEVEFWRSGAGGLRVLGIEFDGLEA